MCELHSMLWFHLLDILEKVKLERQKTDLRLLGAECNWGFLDYKRNV